MPMTGSPPCNPERRPLFSIVIPTFNQERYLERAIQSILCQADDDTECLVVDGGSTDGSHAILRRYRHRLSWWCTEPDKGQSDALNKGFVHARGEFLTWLNADDLLLPGTLAALRRAIKIN